MTLVVYPSVLLNGETCEVNAVESLMNMYEISALKLDSLWVPPRQTENWMQSLTCVSPLV